MMMMMMMHDVSGALHIRGRRRDRMTRRAVSSFVPRHGGGAGVLRELLAVRSALTLEATTTTSSSTWCGGQRVSTYATATKKPTTTAATKKATSKTATAKKKPATKRTTTKKAASASSTTPKISRTKKPPHGRTRALPHVEAMKTPLHESVLNDVAYKAVGLGKWKIVTADAPRKYRAPPKMSGAAPRGLPHASAAKFPLHESVLAEQRAAAQARADAIKGQVEVQPVVPPPPAAEVGAAQAAATTLREPLSKPKSGATSAVPAAAASSSSSSSAGGGHEEQQSASRTPFLAAAGAVLVAYLAYAMGADDPEDLPPPPRRSKPKSKAPAARRDVEVEVQIVKQPEEKDLGSASKGTRAANAATASSSAAEKEKEEAKKELDDAFSAAAEFLANAEVPNKEPSKNDALVSIPNPPVRENASVLNLAKDLNAGALVAEAMKTLGDSLTDEDKAKITRGMEIQSEADVKMFNELASTMIANFERVVGTERSATDELIAAINVLEARADEATRRIENVKEQAARDKESALKEQESKMKAEHADFLVAERIERIKALDEERLRVSALRKVLTKRREALERAYAVQSFELAVIDLGARLEDGEAFDETLKLLKTCSKDDPFVATIVGTVSESVATSGVSTRLQLAEQLERVRQTARQLSLVPAEGGGMFAHGLAYTASLLRMKDSSEDGAQGIEGAIARAEAFLAQGQLTDAASALADAAKGTKAEPSVSDWARNVKNRANLEQAQAALSAHAQCRASALV